jgi:hypothetical protein
MNLENLHLSVRDFQKRANFILSRYETSTSRTITLDDSYKQLNKLSLRQEELFQEAFKCIEHEAFRSAIVMAWAAFMDFLGDKLGEDNFKTLNTNKKWGISNTEELREKASDSVIIECALEVKLIGNRMAKSVRGLLAKRNECGHPSEYKPGLNDSLGFIYEVLKRIELLQKASFP